MTTCAVAGLLDKQRLAGAGLGAGLGAGPGLAQLCDTVESVAQLALDGTEFTCLKALVLFNPHVAGLGGGEQVGVA